MKIIIISNAITPHQIPLCNSLLNVIGVELLFIEVHDIDKSTLPVGWCCLDEKDYVVSSKLYSERREYYNNEILNADVVIIGSAPISLIQKRNNLHKLTFLYSERIYKNLGEKIKRPIHWLKFRNRYNVNPNMYLLCASAFAASDYYSIGCFRDKAYKWGYFTSVQDCLKEDSCAANGTTVGINTIIKIMWCARFVKWKHPELPLQLAKRLKKCGYNFHIDMYGTGELFDYYQNCAVKLNVDDCVTFKGARPNDEIREAMREHDIYVFTSDKNEGWGAVCNEAMSNGCVVVGSHEIGSVPYLVQHGVTGLIFKSGNLSSLFNQIVWLINNPKDRIDIAHNAYKMMRTVWSPENAAKCLVELSASLLGGRQNIISSGPCSKATLLNNNWFRE